MLVKSLFVLAVICGSVVTKELADGCGMNPLLALVAVADKTGTPKLQRSFFYMFA